jgi:ABC-2 type transport system ATP-binding protein
VDADGGDCMTACVAERRSASAIEARRLVKRYGDTLALAGIDLTVAAGDVYGFLGPNGAGKTTAMRIMLGLLRPDEGNALLFGRDPQHELPDALDGVSGFVETPHFYGYLSGRKNLELLAAFDGGGARRRVDELLGLVDLRARADDRVGGYSQGMRQRLGVASSLLRDPRLLILDEPTNGLDPGGMRDMRDLIGRLAGEGITVFLSSHLLAEVEELCSRVAIISRGAIVYEGALAELRRRAAPRYRLRTTDVEAARAICTRQPGVTDLRAEGAELSFGAAEETVVELSRSLVHAGLGIAALVPERETLETLFFELTEQAGVQHEVAA